MNSAKEKADAPAKDTARKNKLSSAYQNLSPVSRKKSFNRIAKRRADMPKIYRANYDKAVSGKSLRASINAFCLECVQWQRVEVRLCTSLACPLFSVRPYQESSEVTSDGADFVSESKNKDSEGDS